METSDAAEPGAAGALDLRGDPTSVAVVGRLALVAVVTNEDPDGDGPPNGYDDPRVTCS